MDAEIWGLSYIKTLIVNIASCQKIILIEIPTSLQPEITIAMMAWWPWQKPRIGAASPQLMCLSWTPFDSPNVIPSCYTLKCMVQFFVFCLFKWEGSNDTKASIIANTGEFLT